MKITAATLRDFHAWMLRRNRDPGTADLYVKHLRAAAAEPTLTTRLHARSGLAPLTMRTAKAALAAWAKYTKDEELKELLDDVKLPPARRQSVKQPLSVAEWKRLAQRIGELEHRDPILAPVCLIIVRRGLRVGDTLRIRRAEVLEALSSGTLSFVGKGQKRHEFSAAPIRAQLAELAAVKRSWKTVADLVCAGRHATSPHNRIRRVFERAAKGLQIKGVHPHRFRRTYATAFLEQLAGDPQALIKLQQHMGWANLTTAAGYADAVSREDLARVGDKMVAGVLD